MRNVMLQQKFADLSYCLSRLLWFLRDFIGKGAMIIRVAPADTLVSGAWGSQLKNMADGMENPT
jgi:hypothetical protein